MSACRYPKTMAQRRATQSSRYIWLISVRVRCNSPTVRANGSVERLGGLPSELVRALIDFLTRQRSAKVGRQSSVTYAPLSDTVRTLSPKRKTLLAITITNSVMSGGAAGRN